MAESLSSSLLASPVPRLKPGIRISRFIDNSESQARYLVEQGASCFVVNEPMRDLVLALESAPGNLEDLAASYERQTGELVEPEVLRQLLDSRLPPSLFEDGPEEIQRKPFLVSFQLMPPWLLHPITSRLSWLFNKFLVIPVLVAFAAVEFMVLPYALERMSSSLLSHEVLYLFLAITGIGLFHELGHATACIRYGAPHGGVGFGLYLVFPAFYADVTKAWRLPPRQRAVVDLGGLYFQCVLLIPLGLIALVTGNALLLHVIWVVNFMMLFTLNPVFKMDGYWLLSDLSGLRNLRKRMNETLLILVRKLRRKPLPEQTLTAVTGARRKVLYAYTGLALAYYLYLLPVAVRALTVTLWRYPARASRPLGMAISSIQDGSYLEALQAVGSLIHISIWPAIVGLIIMRLFYKMFQGLVMKVNSAVKCVVKGLCHCQPAPAANTEISPIEGRSEVEVR